MLVLYTYLAYLTLSIAVTVWVARTLHKNGRAFLVDAFHGQEALAEQGRSLRHYRMEIKHREPAVLLPLSAGAKSAAA